MGIFDRFRRNRQDGSVLPAEVNEYYESEQRDRRGVAVLLGIITLIITLLIAVGLFYGGRAVYRAVTNDDKPAAVETNPDKNKAKQGVDQQSVNSSPTQPSDSPPAATPTPSPATPTPSPTPTPATGDEPASNLPRTGDE